MNLRCIVLFLFLLPLGASAQLPTRPVFHHILPEQLGLDNMYGAQTDPKGPIGIHVGDKKPFTRHEIAIEKGDQFYMSSDGYADQFGGEKGKKFKTSNFEKLIVQVSAYDMPQQLHHINDVFNRWKGDYEQLDDVCVIGVKL